MPENHALLGPSSTDRWLNCSRSIAASKGIEGANSDYADEGTLAHLMAETELLYFINELSQFEFEEIQEQIQESPYYSKSMEGYVGVYVRTVKEGISQAFQLHRDLNLSYLPKIVIEARLETSWFVPDGFGTADAVIITRDYVSIIDLKYGKGVAVSAIDNSQLRSYGLGALQTFNQETAQAAHVITTIVQPRLTGGITSEVNTREELIKWGYEVLRPGAEEAFTGKGVAVAGDHCQFCPIKAICKTRSDFFLADLDVSEPKERMSLAEIAKLLPKLDSITSYANDLRKYALDSAVKGETVPGYKVVKSKQNRKIKDADTVQWLLKSEGIDESLYMKPRALESLTNLEKKLGPKTFDLMLGDFITKTEGKPILVPETDGREAWNPNSELKCDILKEKLNGKARNTRRNKQSHESGNSSTKSPRRERKRG